MFWRGTKRPSVDLGKRKTSFLGSAVGRFSGGGGFGGRESLGPHDRASSEEGARASFSLFIIFILPEAWWGAR